MTPRTLMKALRAMHRRTMLMIAKGALKLVYDEGELQRVQTGALAGELRDRVVRLQEYGYTSYPLTGAEVLLLCHGGNRDHPIAISVDDRRHRPKGAAIEGDVALYHFLDDRDATAEDALHRITLTRNPATGKRRLVIRCDELDIACGQSSLTMTTNGVKLVTPDFEATQAVAP